MTYLINENAQNIDKQGDMGRMSFDVIQVLWPYIFCQLISDFNRLWLSTGFGDYQTVPKDQTKNIQN